MDGKGSAVDYILVNSVSIYTRQSSMKDVGT